MALDRPLWGWGPGQFVLHQQPYTRIGRGAENVARYGATFDDMAFNEYLQTAAELGFPGLALYLLVLISFASKAWRAAGRLPHGVRRTALLGCLGGVGAYAVDALGNVSWRYIECDMFFWLLLGLGMAIVRMAYESGSQLTAHAKDVGL